MYSFVMPKIKIQEKENGKNVIYSFDKDSNLFIISSSVLTADPNIYRYKVNLEDISKIEIRNGSGVWTGAAVGIATGFIAGMFAGGKGGFHGSTEKFNVSLGILMGAIFALPAGLIGALVGSLFYKYNEYNVLNLNGSNYESLIKIFRENKIKN